MISSHPKINSEHLHATGSLLDDDEHALVGRIQTQVALFQAAAAEHAKKRDAVEVELMRLNALSEIASQPNIAIETAFFSQTEDPNDYKAEVIAALIQLEAQLKEPSVKDFVNEVRVAIEVIEVSQGKDKLLEQYLDRLSEIFEIHEENAVDNQLLASLEEQFNTQNALKDESDEALHAINDEVEAYKSDNQFDFDLDDAFNLLKISKRTDGLSFSVLFVQDEDKAKAPEPYVLYRGKGQILGAGEIGQVKLCQKLNKSEASEYELQAVKILPLYLKEGSQYENEALQSLGRYHGEVSRSITGGGKYYAVQTLLPGKNLEEHIIADKHATLESRLEIAKQAVECVEHFHQQKFLHRDIKTDNFMWDNETQTLYLCDLGYACRVGNEGKDSFGTGTYIAPEVLATTDGNPMPYSEKSDIYSLGKTLEVLFKDIEPIPEEVQALVTDMTKASPEERAGDMRAMISVLDEAIQLVSEEANRPQA